MGHLTLPLQGNPCFTHRPVSSERGLNVVVYTPNPSVSTLRCQLLGETVLDKPSAILCTEGAHWAPVCCPALCFSVYDKQERLLRS